MKTIITAILLFLSVSIIFGQDTEMFNFINLYRKHNGKKELKLSTDLSKISVEQNNKIITEDSLSHSHKTSEIAVMGKNLPSTVESKLDFYLFIESLGIKYVEPKTEEEAIKNAKLYCLFLFDKSPKHKNILLGDYTNVGFDIVIKDVIYKSNKIVVNGVETEFKKIKSHYLVKFYCVANFN